MSEPPNTSPPEPPASPPPSPQPPPVERSITPVSGRLGTGRAGKGMVFLALVAGCGVFVVATWGREGAPKAERMPVQPARQIVRFEPLNRSPTLAAPGAGAPTLVPGEAGGAQVPALAPDGRSDPPIDAETKRQAELAAMRAAPILAFSRGGSSVGANASLPGSVAVQQAAAADATTELDQLRQGSKIGRAQASRLGDRNFLILAGTAIPCILQTAMDTATPGYVSCLIPRDVLSDNGAVVLMEKGTRVLGEYRSGMRQGQQRLFVLWTRAVTPAGVAVGLASPAADPLGRAGFDGALDTHFWDRFGAGILLSVVDDGVAVIAGDNNQYATTRMPSQAAALAVQGGVNIPPTLRKAQGSEVSIFAAQDFDFSGVYGLKAR